MLLKLTITSFFSDCMDASVQMPGSQFTQGSEKLEGLQPRNVNGQGRSEFGLFGLLFGYWLLDYVIGPRWLNLLTC